jgi:protein-tyrosine phosphatase
MFNNILMVCIGNICRSPSAEYLLKHKLAHKSGLIIHSAGLGALVGKPIDSNAGELLLANGVDASTHIARQVTGEMLLKADLILVMEQRHIKGITELAPQVSGKTFLLGKWSQNQPVPDPYRKSMEAFEHVYGQMNQFTDDWLKYLK